MDIKVNSIMPTQQVEQTNTQQQVNGDFKFTLMSHIEEAGLQERLTSMME